MVTGEKFAFRPVVYGIAAVYLLADLVFFKGPIRQQFDLAHPNISPTLAVAKQDDVIARVDGHPISRSRLDRVVSERLWLVGQSPATVTPPELKAARASALDDLLEHELLRLQVKDSIPKITVGDDEINARLKLLTSRFDSESVLETAMKTQGIASFRELKKRLSAQLREEKFVALQLGESVNITDEEARKWFGENPLTAQQPERVEARHIFIPTLDHPSEAAKQKLETALAALTENSQDFTTLAKALSEDPSTKDSGGALGWMTRDRLPADFSTQLFSLQMNQPRLLRTKLGWHLVEVTARKPAVPRTFEQAKPEIIAALEALKSQKAVAKFRKSLRQSDSAKIEILHDMPPL